MGDTAGGAPRRRVCETAQRELGASSARSLNPQSNQFCRLFSAICEGSRMPKKRKMDVKCAEVRAGGLAERRDCLSCARRGGWEAVRRAARSAAA